MTGEPDCTVRQVSYRPGHIEFVAEGWSHGGHVTIVSEVRISEGRHPTPREQVREALEQARFLLKLKPTR